MMAASRNFYLRRTLTCLILLVSFILGSFLLGFTEKFFPSHSQLENEPVYEEQRELQPVEDNSYEIPSKKSVCTCPPKQKGLHVYNLTDYLATSDLQSASDRREKEYQHYKKRQQTENILFAPTNSPLGYPTYGVHVSPLNTINLPGLQISAVLPQYTVQYQKTTNL